MEKQTLRTVVQALQEASHRIRLIFETTPAVSDSEVIVMAEDLTHTALNPAECYPISQRFAGFIDYKRVRWCSTIYGIIPQVILVDSKASTENNRETLQQSQLQMDADFICKGQPMVVKAGVPPHMLLHTGDGTVPLVAVTSSLFVHFHYSVVYPTLYENGPRIRYRHLHAIYVLSLPHQRLKPKYNPGPDKTFYGQGKHSSARNEQIRVRVYFSPLREMCPWRFQSLFFENDVGGYTSPLWRDQNDDGREVVESFGFLGDF
jgi:hypothetical protein